MKNKKTMFLWILIILEILNILVVLVTLFTSPYSGNAILGYVGIGLNVINLIIAIIWLHRALLLKKDIIKWTHINFRFGILLYLFGIVGIYINYDGSPIGVISTTITAVIMLVVWFAFIKHLRRAISENRIQLN